MLIAKGSPRMILFPNFFKCPSVGVHNCLFYLTMHSLFGQFSVEEISCHSCDLLVNHFQPLYVFEPSKVSPALSDRQFLSLLDLTKSQLLCSALLLCSSVFLAFGYLDSRISLPTWLSLPSVSARLCPTHGCFWTPPLTC